MPAVSFGVVVLPLLHARLRLPPHRQVDGEGGRAAARVSSSFCPASRRVRLRRACHSLVSKHGRKWTFIGSELNRLPCSCRDKWRLVKKINNTLTNSSSDWFREEDEALVSSIMKSERLDIIGASDVRSDPDADERSDRSWLLIAEQLDVNVLARLVRWC